KRRPGGDNLSTQTIFSFVEVAQSSKSYRKSKHIAQICAVTDSLPLACTTEKLKTRWFAELVSIGLTGCWLQFRHLFPEQHRRTDYQRVAEKINQSRSGVVGRENFVISNRNLVLANLPKLCASG